MEAKDVNEKHLSYRLVCFITLSVRSLASCCLAPYPVLIQAHLPLSHCWTSSSQRIALCLRVVLSSDDNRNSGMQEHKDDAASRQ